MSTTATGQPITRRNTRQRQLVLDAVRSRCDHPTAEDIYLQVRETDERVSRGTVYRNLNLLTEAGVITTVKTPGTTRFDWRCDGHGHAVCRCCGAVADVMLPYDDGLDERAGLARVEVNFADDLIALRAVNDALAYLNGEVVA